MYECRLHAQRQNLRDLGSHITHLNAHVVPDGRAALDVASRAAQRPSRRLARMGHEQPVHEKRNYLPPRSPSPTISKGERIMVPVVWLVVLALCGAWASLLAAATARFL